MSFKAWSLLVIIVGLAYLSGYLIQGINDVSYYAYHAATSLAVIYLVTRIPASLVGVGVQVIEAAAFAVNGLSYHDIHYINFVYSNYEAIIESLALVQAALLTLGGLIYGAINIFERHWDSVRMGRMVHNRICSRDEMDSTIYKGFEGCMAEKT